VSVPIFYCFCVSKKLHRNILGIGRNESRSSYFTNTKTESKGEMEEARRRPHHRMARATPGHATRWCGPLVHPLISPFRLYILSEVKTLERPVSIHEKFHSAAAIKDQFRGTKVSVPAPCRDGELPPEPSPLTPPPSSSLLMSPMMRRE
jgi:hypothetical protein